MLVEALGLRAARLIALAGAGGKTTLMLALAREFVAAGERVLVTTTTKIARAETAGPWPTVITGTGDIAAPARAALPVSGSGAAVIAVSGATEGGDKLTGFPPDQLDRIRDDAGFDRILVEADGAARRPLKAPADHEPVIPATTDALVIVAGLDGLGRPLDEETVFRADRWAASTGLAPGAPVTAESLARMVVHERGLAKGCPDRARRILFLNRAEDPPHLADAARVAEALAEAEASERRPERVVAGCLRPAPRIAEVVVF